MGFPQFWWTELVLTDRIQTNYECKINWSPWTREQCEAYIYEHNDIHGSYENASAAMNCVSNGLYNSFCLHPVMPREKAYWIVILIVCFLIPIIILIGSYAGLGTDL